MWKIDAFCHVLPPRYVEALQKKSKVPLTPRAVHIGRYGMRPMPTLTDLEARLALMDRYPGYVQILNTTLPPPEDVTSPEDTVELCKIANDSMAELVYRYPDRFVAAIACLPLNDVDAAMGELERAIKELKFRGIQITTTIMDEPLDSPKFEPLFERMSYYNLPIQIHPRTMTSGARVFDEGGEKIADKVGLWAQVPFNWPFETTIAMGRLVFSGLLEKYPNLKLITHHLGGLVPYQIERVTYFTQQAEMRFGLDMFPEVNFTKSYADYYRMFYNDTACYGATASLMCGYAFFGADHMLFGTDAPYDSMGGGPRIIPATIRSVEEMAISEAEKRMIFQVNAQRLFRLPL